MRRGALLSLIAIALGVAVGATAVALVPDWLPDQASKEREGIDLVFWLTIGICIFIFSLVAGVSIYAGIRFRARPDDDSDGPPIHGHTGLEILWTAVPAVLVTVIAVASAIVLAQNDRTGANALRVDVTAQQFAWSFKYPNNGGITSSNLYLPVNRSTKLYLQSRDVIHSFWVPEFGQKQDVVPGIVTTLVITPTKLGEYRVICTELCGLGHALMRTRAIVLSQPDFAAWARKQRRAAAGPPGQLGSTVFENNGCGSCHTLTAAGAKGKVGPDLDDLPAAARRANKPLEPFIRESIVNPNAYIETGFQRNVMPPTFGQLPKDQLDALVQYLVEASRK